MNAEHDDKWSGLPVDAWCKAMEKAVENICGLGFQILEQHGQAGEASKEISGKWKLSERQACEQKALQDLFAAMKELLLMMERVRFSTDPELQREAADLVQQKLPIIEKAFGAEFSKRGLEYVQEGGDLIVTLFIVIEEKTSTTATTNQMGGGYGYYGRYYGYGPGYGWGGGYSTTTIDEYDYQVGTLVCDVFDAKKEVLVWEGIGTKTIAEDPAKREKTIPEAVQAIMSRFPVTPKQ